jgi:hypothetical protein
MEMYHVIKTARLSEKIRERWKISARGFLEWETFFLVENLEWFFG